MKNSLLLLLMWFASVLHAQVVADQVLADWEFEANPHKKYLHKFCAGSVVPISDAYQGIRTIKNKQNPSEVRHRFTLGKAVYQSIDEAQMAVAEINNPVHRSSKYAKMCDLRQAFNVAHVLYFVHTDVGNLRPEIDVMLDRLSQHVQQAQ